MTNSENYKKFIECIDATIISWRCADRATELEQRARAQQTIYGIATAALYVLPENEYQNFIAYIHEKGFNH